MQSRDTKRTADKPDILQFWREQRIKFKSVGHFLLAFLLADACLMGYIRPFVLCYALTLDEEDRLWGCAGAFLGSLMIGGPGGGMIYGAVGIVTLTVDTFLLRQYDARELFLPLLLAGVITIIKMPFALLEGMGYVGLLLLESVLTALCGYCLLLPREGEGGRVRRSVLAIMLISAFSGLKLLGLISPAGAAAVVLTMAATYGASCEPAAQAGENGVAGLGGAAFGMVIGAFLDMSCSTGPFFAAVFGLSAVIALLLPWKGRIHFSLVFLLAGIVLLLWGFDQPQAMGAIYDYFIAASVFLLLPEEQMAFSVPKGTLHTSGMISPSLDGAALRLRDLSRAITALARSVGEPSAGEEDISVIFDHAASAVCKKCNMAGLCWIDDYVSTVGDFNDLLNILQKRGHAAPGDLSGVLAARCGKKTELCADINQEYMSYLRRKAQRISRREQNDLLRQQYAGIGAAVDSLAERARYEYIHKPLAEKQIRTILAAYRWGLKAEVYQKKGRLHIAVGLFEPGDPWIDEEAFVRSAERALGCRFLPAERVCGKGGEQYLYKEREALRVTISCAVRKKPGEEVCGDSHIFFNTDDGRAVVLLSDGMGTGPEAAALSKNAIDLIAAFVRSGCSVEESARAVVPFLRARSADGFATLDLLEIDLFTGAGKLIKCGAADSYILEKGQAVPVSVPSLPPGADPGSSEMPGTVDLYLRDGSRILMASDGAEWKDPALLCRAELTAGEVVRACGEENSDDLTVLIISVVAADKIPDREAE